MKEQLRFDGTLRYIDTHWPTILLSYGGGSLLILLVILVSFRLGWWAFVLPALAASLILAYFFMAMLWAAHEQYDKRENLDHHILFNLSDLEPTDSFAHVNLGSRMTAIGLSRRLTSGHLSVIDVYNPQLTPGRALVRLRRRNAHPPADPRLSWLDGSINLLPLPDNSVKVVTMSRMLSEFWQHGDRLRLLQEIDRVLVPGGRLLLAERTRTETNALVMGTGVLRLAPAGYWQALLQEAGFNIHLEQNVRGLVHYWRADKPYPNQPRQLSFDFGL